MNSSSSLERVVVKRKGTVDWSDEEIKQLLGSVLENKCVLQSSGEAETEETKDFKLKKGVLFSGRS